MKSFFALATSLLAAAFLACGSDSSSDPNPGPSCPELPQQCAGTPPSYSTEIKSLVEQHCFPCHAPGGTGVGAAGRDFSKYEILQRDKAKALLRVYGCTMPPKEAPQPSADDRATLVKWLVCGAPNN
ncbi:cytochrome c [Pendulispora brunnea]|uniref:Cytochrome c n=1 Tax=Pendulispora brunnea TaxID=2905690 RepID=A0ABZ2K909_9BACT